ncbi:hypothetical protein LINPERHAP1_LOCUS14649 [Linum perenne]
MTIVWSNFNLILRWLFTSLLTHIIRNINTQLRLFIFENSSKIGELLLDMSTTKLTLLPNNSMSFRSESIYFPFQIIILVIS